MSITAHAAGLHLEKDFGATNYTPPVTWYVGFRSAGTELSGGSYARIAVTNNTTNWPATATNEISNGTTITTPQATALWDEADEVALYDASSGGNLWYYDSLDQPFQMQIGQIRSFAAGALVIRLI